MLGMLSPYARLLVLLDYDGTITTHECNEIVLQRFTGDSWRAHEEALHRGRIGHAECLRRQIALLQEPRSTIIEAMVSAAELAPGLAETLATLSAGGARVAVVSAGFREVIERVWQRERLSQAAILASELGTSRPYRITYNPALGTCPTCGPAACKGAVARTLRSAGDTVAVFGDGHADLCLAREADLVFARGALATLCASQNITYHPLGDFRDALATVDATLQA